jgi:hypothetical protein
MLTTSLPSTLCHEKAFANFFIWTIETKNMKQPEFSNKENSGFLYQVFPLSES